MYVAMPIRKAKLGQTGLDVTNIRFGSSGIGDMPETYDYSVGEERGKSTIRSIFSGPVNFLDTSRIYGMGRSEHRIGDVVRELGGLAKGFVVSTMLDRDFTTNRFDVAQARRSLEESLKAASPSIIVLPTRSFCSSPTTKPNFSVQSSALRVKSVTLELAT